MIRLAAFTLLGLCCYLGYRWNIPTLQTGVIFVLAATSGAIYSEVWK